MVVIRRIVKVIPMPDRVVKKVNAWGIKTKKDLSVMKSLEFCDRNKKEFGWENEEFHDDHVVEEGQQKLVHPDIIAETPGIELESDYDTVTNQAQQEETLVTANHAERVELAQSRINLNQEQSTGKVKGVDALA